MPTLHDTLSAMTASLLHGETGAGSLVEDGTFSADQQLRVHRNNIFAGLDEALVAIYPVVQKLVGEDFFRTACRHFIPAQPPRAAPLHDFGKGFAAFLESYEAAQALAYLPDVARLEWEWHRSFHAADAGAFNASILTEVAVVDHGQLHFSLHPAARLLHSKYPVYRIWEVNQDEYTGDTAVDLDQGDSFVAVVRPRLDVRVQSLPGAEWRFLASLRDGLNLDEAYRYASRIDPGFDLAEVLQRRVTDRTLIRAFL